MTNDRRGTDVVAMEHHDQALHEWRRAGVGRRTLVHVDAHHDMWWVEPDAPVTIANFICAALREDLAGDVFWVVPDATLGSRACRAAVRTFLQKIAGSYPRPRAPIVEGPSSLRVGVLGRRVTACALASVPRFDDPVLLDIDTDYLVIPEVTYGATDRHGASPWCWPEDLVRCLADRGIESACTTIAYSVEGGFTPLEWKYLGDEVAARLGNRERSSLPAYASLRRAAEAGLRGERAAEERALTQSAEQGGAGAAPWFRLARLLASVGRVPEAREAYRRALDLDPSYRTPYAGRGFVHLGDGQLLHARTEFERLLVLDETNAFAWLGLGQLLARRGAWAGAEEALRVALDADETLLDGHRELGRVLTAQGRTRAAIAAYERSLALALRGSRPVTGPFLTVSGRPRVLDPDHSKTHAALARLYHRSGATARATQGFEMSIAGGYDGAALRSRLAGLYLHQRAVGRAVAQIGRAVLALPNEARVAWRHARRTWRRVLSPQSV
jgi:tetratricopeptide (TPR) repeat protein